MTTATTRIERLGMERHIQTGIGIIITSLMLWVGMSVSDLREVVARQDERLAQLQRAVLLMQDLKEEVAGIRDRVIKLEVKAESVD